MEIMTKSGRSRGAAFNLEIGNISLALSGIHPPLKSCENEKRKVFVLGSPIYNDRIDYERVKEALLNKEVEEFIRDVNGSFLFLIYQKFDKTLTVANDRFASMQFFYRMDGRRLFGATNYSDIWKRFRGTPGFRINEEAFYEFIYMRRIFGNKTYDRDTRFLDSASILKFKGNTGELKTDRYWRPNCDINGLTENENAHKLAFLIEQSLKRVTSDEKRVGLLLSGGLDSRAIIAASDRPMSCFTTCEYRNNEVRVASELSRVKNYEHHFIEKPGNYYSDIIDKAVYISGAMSIYVNAHLFNIEKAVRDKVDVLLSGYGFDFLFRGKYLPATLPQRLKTLTYWRRLMRIGASEKDVAEEFIDNLSFRLKSVDPASILNVMSRKKMMDSLYHQVKDITDEARGFSGDPYKWWDYCCFRNISRHYSWPNLLSISCFMEERTVALDNDLFDFFWSLDTASRHNGKIFKEVIKILDPAVFKVRYANTNLSLGDPLFVTTAKIILNKVLKDTKLNRIFTKSVPPPSAKERSWPIDADLVRDNTLIRSMASGLCDSGSLEALGFLNMDTVSSCVKEHLERKKSHTNLILSLITLDRFLKLGK
ncbi:MAG: hypothetical protein ISS34_00030 [Candidatus Omnitrophica bacterium]|nr:hypothetical protein [Candidatus Omnitrophota bacterium]